MWKELKCEIPEIKFPEKFKSTLLSLTDALAEAIKTGQADFDVGETSIPSLSENQAKATFFLIWVRETDEILKNIRIIISDLRQLPDIFPTLTGSPVDRFHFLVKAYFSEFFCLKEVFNRATKSATLVKLLSPEHVEGLRKIFYDRFEQCISIRNKIIHQSIGWKGKDYFDLIFQDAARKQGYYIACKEDGKDTFQENLRKICEEFSNELHTEAVSASGIISSIMNTLAEYDGQATIPMKNTQL